MKSFSSQNDLSDNDPGIEVDTEAPNPNELSDMLNALMLTGDLEAQINENLKETVKAVPPEDPDNNCPKVPVHAVKMARVVHPHGEFIQVIAIPSDEPVQEPVEEPVVQVIPHEAIIQEVEAVQVETQVEPHGATSIVSGYRHTCKVLPGMYDLKSHKNVDFYVREKK